MEAKEFFEEKKSNMRELSNLSDVQRDMVCSLMEQYVALHIADVVGRSEQLKPEEQICYKSNKPCKHDCSGLCRESC